MADNVHVAIRVRPLIDRESGYQSHWKYDRKSISLIGQNKPYIFDRVFAQDEVTEDVYREIAQPIVQAAMNGYSGTIFAYGQTSSGKTFTMQGDDKEPGIIPKAVNELFEIIENTPKREFLFRVSYMELYNEVITDLLVEEEKDRVQLIIRENEQKKIFVSNLIEEVVTDADAVLNVMNRGNARRHIGQTNMNEHSSRSHTIFKLTIESCEKGDAHDSMDLAVKVSELNLIDLAGSERANETKAQGLRLKEAGNINRSLFALCNVISKLSTGADFIPFRDSKLTRILQSALGGNSKTAVICTVTPVSTDQTDSTLQFASRAKTIQTKPEINEILTGEAQIQRCQKEIKSLRSQLELYQQGMPMQDQDRIAQLEEEKSVQQEKIKQLQSMILVSKAKPVTSFAVKKKRRMTWCPGKLGHSRQSMLDDPMVPLQKLHACDAVSLPNQSFRAGADFSFSMAAELPEEYSPVTKRSRVVMWADNTSAVATQTEPPEDSTSQEKEAESKRLQETFAICDAFLKDKPQMEKQIMESSVELTSLRGTISTLEFENVKLASENERLRHFIEDTVSTNDLEDNEKLMLEEYQHELTEIIGSLKQELQQSHQSKAEIEIQLGADKGRLERRVNELTAQLQQAYDDHSEAANRESEIVSENQQLRQELKGTTEAFQLAKEELESLKEASAKHLEEMTQQRQAFQGLEADLADARRNFDGREEEWKALLAEKSSELDTNREELTHARLELQNKETESKELLDRLEEHQERLGVVEGNLRDAKTALETQELKLRREHVLNLEELKTANDELRAMFEGKEQECEKLAEVREVEQSRLDAAEEELCQMKTNLDSSEGELRLKLSEVEATNKQLREDLGNPEQKYQRVLEEMEVTNRNRLTALEASLADFKECLAAKEEALKKQSEELEMMREELGRREGSYPNNLAGEIMEGDVVNEETVSVMESKRQELESSLDEVRQLNEGLKEDLGNKNIELERVLEELKTQKAHLDEATKWQQLVGSMETQLAEAGREFERREQELQRQLVDVDAQRLELQQAGLETSNDVLQRQQPMAMDVVSMKEEFEHRVQDLQTETDNLRAQREELQSRLEGMQSTGDDGTDHDLRLQDHQRKVEELQTQNESLEKLVEDHQARIEELRKQNESLEEHQKKIEELQRQNESLEELVEEYLKRIEELHTQNKSLEELLEGNEREMELWRTEADNQRGKLEGVITDSELAFMAKEVTYQERIDALEDQKKELQESLANHKSQMECMNTSAAELEASKQESSSRIVELEMQVNVLEDEKKELQESLTNHESQVGSMSTSGAELEASKQACFDRIVELEVQVNTLENEKKELQESLANHKSQVESMNTSAAELEASKQDCLKRIAELEMLQVTENGLVGEEVSSYQERIEVLEREKNDLQEELEKEVDRQTQLVDLEITIEDLKAEKEEAVTKLEMKEQELEIASNETEKQITELMAERDQINKDLQDSINCYTNTIECLKKENGDLEKAISDIKQEKDKLYEDSHQQQEALVLRNEELEASKEGLTRKLEETENQLRELNNEAERLREEGHHVVNDAQIKLSDEITSLRKEKEDLERIVNDLQQKLEDRVQDCENNQREMEELGERNTELEIHLEELRELAEEQKEKYETEAKNEQLQHTSTVTILQNENSDLQQDITNLEQELQEHLREKEETQKQLEELVENNIDLENQLKELHEEQERSKETSENLEELTNTITRLQKEKLDLQQAGFALEQRLDELSEGNRSREETEDLLEKNVQLETKLKELKESAEREIEKYNILERGKTDVEKRLKKVEQAASSKYRMMLANIKTTQELHKQQEATEELLKKREERIRELEQRLQSNGGDSQKEDLEASKRRIGDLTKSNSDLQKKLELQEKDMSRKYRMLKSSVQRAQQLYGEEMAAREATEKRLEEEREKVKQMQQQQHQTQGPVLSTSTPGNHTKEELTDLVHELQAQQASNQRQIQQLEQIMKEAADPTAIASGSGVVAAAVVPHLRTYNTKLEKENVEVGKQLRKVQELYKNERMKYAEMKKKKLHWKTEFQKVKKSQLRNSSMSSPKKPLKDNNTPIITHHPAPPGKAQSVDCPGSSRTQENLHRATVRKAALASEEGPTDPSVSGQPTWLEEAYADLENPENCKQQ